MSNNNITVALVISRKSCFPKYEKGNFVAEKGFICSDGATISPGNT